MNLPDIVAALRYSAGQADRPRHFTKATDAEAQVHAALLRRLAQQMEGAQEAMRDRLQPFHLVPFASDEEMWQRVLVIPWPDDDQQAGGKI